jgi:hypothetical protein
VDYRLRSSVVPALALSAVIAAWLSLRAAEDPPTASRAPGSADPGIHDVVGTQSCAARWCHGAPAPLPTADRTIQQNEYTRWVFSGDKHQRAYAVLQERLSQEIGCKLGIAKPHENARCLACHTNPMVVRVASASAGAYPVADASQPTWRSEWSSGVGCEACHGAARDWLESHTLASWRKLSAAEKRACGMVPMEDRPRFFESCVGCHVGAPPGKTGTPPLRDVNHDLIAAGHPRLNFELGVFLANMPPHWNSATREKTAKPGDGMRLWAAGQLMAARAALKLLAHRASLAPASPWPEFSEYDCFACHHDLQVPSWRQKRGYAGRQPGAMPWSDWYYAGPRALARAAPKGNPTLGGQLDKLYQEMAHPWPDPGVVARAATSTEGALAAWQDHVDLARSREKWIEVVKELTRANPKRASGGWDIDAQAYLAVAALEADARIGPELPSSKLAELLSFPTGTGKSRFNSPKNFFAGPGADKSGKDQFDAEIQKTLAALASRKQ